MQNIIYLSASFAIPFHPFVNQPFAHQGRLSQHDIERMLKDAEAHKVQIQSNEFVWIRDA